MPIKKSSDQGPESLEQFYTSLAQKDFVFFIAVGKEMLAFLEMVNGLFLETQLWGQISQVNQVVDSLIIQNEDGNDAEPLLIVESLGMGDYHFQYKMMPDKSPWNFAKVRGSAKNIEEAKRYLLIAMRESGGWASNIELERLLEEHRL